MRASRRAGHSIWFGLVNALVINWAPRLLRMQCPEFLTDRVIAFAQHGLTEQRGPASQWRTAARGPLVKHDVLVQVLQSPSALSCLIRTLSFFDGVMISSKNTSWRTEDAPTLIQSWQSVMYRTTSDAYASVITGLPSVTVVGKCAVHQCAAMMSIRTLRVVWLLLR